MGEWVLETACRQAMHWRSLGLEPLVVGVNVSARQFQQGNLVQTVAKHLQATGLPAALLELELTESAVMNDPERTLQILREIKAVGVRIALDDFGTGYSSLNYLKRFPVDCLKIDQSFVRDISIDPEDAAIARMVVTLGHSLRQVVVAEGVETQAQLDFLREQKCDLIQGYLFSPPVPANELEAMLRSGRRLMFGA
jgi:EAL domain-containing protein (putative c-di-GMP-specific phosphodiesterase class I)